MNQSFIERIFPHSPGSRLPQYEYDSPTSRSPASPPRISLQDSVASSSTHSREQSSVSSRQRSQRFASSLVRHNDPFLPVERASKALEKILQTLLDAQSEGLSAGIGSGAADDTSSVGSPTPTPSVATPTSRRDSGLRTIPIRQPKPKKVTLRGARRGLGKSMREFADLKRHELTLIQNEVVARDEALKQVSDLGNRRTVLEDEIQKIKEEQGSVGLRSEVQKVEQEIQELENTLFELKARHRHLVARLKEEDSTKESRLSSYNGSIRLNDAQTRHFLRHPPVVQSLGPDFENGMYALKPERRTLQMAQEQWTAELEMLNLRKSDVESEKAALDEGSALWRDIVQRINEFERELKAQTQDLSESQLQSYSGDPGLARLGLDASMHAILTKLSTLISELQRDLRLAEQKNWNLLICAIGAEVAAFEQARDLLTGTADLANGDVTMTSTDSDGLIEPNVDDENQDMPHEDLLSGLTTASTINGAAPKTRSLSLGESSNQSLEDTLREFERGVVLPDDKGERNGVSARKANTSEDTVQVQQQDPKPDPLDDGAGDGNIPAAEDPASTVSSKGKAKVRELSESEDDDPDPDFFLSHG